MPKSLALTFSLMLLSACSGVRTPATTNQVNAQNSQFNRVSAQNSSRVIVGSTGREEVEKEDYVSPEDQAAQDALIDEGSMADESAQDNEDLRRIKAGSKGCLTDGEPSDSCN